MNRGRPALVAAVSLALAAIAFEGASQPPPAAGPFDVMEKSIDALQRAMDAQLITSAALVEASLARIAAYDRQGPALTAMLAINPRAVETARELDRERAATGPRGPLHGIPIVVKDNFDTADLPTTGGSVALVGLRPSRDAFQVRRLREAGAVIIGKTNLHELAAGITTVSSLGGHTRNPYDPARNPGGSSGGTGAAVAASFAVAGMGTDTCGSIRIPAAHNSLVGLRGTQGLSSRDGIIPLSHTQDIGGPLARTAADLAILLDATVGPDPADPSTDGVRGRLPSTFRDGLNAQRLRGARIGLLKASFGDTADDNAVGHVVRQALDAMKAQGAEIVDVATTDLDALAQRAGVIDYEFKFDLAEYLSRAANPPVASLGEMLERGLYHEALESTLRRRDAVKTRDSEEYRKALAARMALKDALLDVLKSQRLDALAYPPIRRTAALIGEAQPGANCRLSAYSGLPAISMPAGYTEEGLPVGLELLGAPYSDVDLVAMAYAFEQATHVRRPPLTTPPLVHGKAPGEMALVVTATGSEMVPPVGATPSARLRLRFDPVGGDLSYAIDGTALDRDAALAVTVHRAARGQNGPVVRRLTAAADGRLSGRVRLSMRERADLARGGLYVEIATARYPAGLRAQLKLP